jgi:hypothetical protein
MTGAFVIQYHQTPLGDHFDLMLEAGPALATFQLPRRLDELAQGEQIVAPRLNDHRREYLTYEGPIKGGRGQVRIVDRGTFTSTQEGDLWVVRLKGKLASGEFHLRWLGEGKYLLSRGPDA